MTDRPIIFSAPMVRALLDGRKTQTRRLAWGCPITLERPGYTRLADGRYWRPSPWTRVQPGDRLWVREAWRPDHYRPDEAIYLADGPADAVAETRGIIKWRPSIHMPRWASRITLTVTQARRQRLQDIIQYDAADEGICDSAAIAYGFDGRAEFAKLWNTLHGEDAWQANPEVVAITFTVARRNIDTAAQAA